MDRVLLVGLGGFLGSVARYGLSGFAQSLSPALVFPVGTLAVNILGCLAIGFLGELADSHGLFSSASRSFLFIGVLGGFTTFSAFANETMFLLRGSERMAAALNVTSQLLLGLFSVWLGRALAHGLWR